MRCSITFNKYKLIVSNMIKHFDKEQHNLHQNISLYAQLSNFNMTTFLSSITESIHNDGKGRLLGIYVVICYDYLGALRVLGILQGLQLLGTLRIHIKNSFDEYMDLSPVGQMDQHCVNVMEVI